MHIVVARSDRIYGRRSCAGRCSEEPVGCDRALRSRAPRSPPTRTIRRRTLHERSAMRSGWRAGRRGSVRPWNLTAGRAAAEPEQGLPKVSLRFCMPPRWARRSRASPLDPRLVGEDRRDLLGEHREREEAEEHRLEEEQPHHQELRRLGRDRGCACAARRCAPTRSQQCGTRDRARRAARREVPHELSTRRAGCSRRR